MNKQKKHYIILILAGFLINFVADAKPPVGWQVFIATGAGVIFEMPPNVVFAEDTLATRMYAAEIDSTEAVQVHIVKDAEFDSSDEFFSTALMLENGDVLRAIARLALLVTDSELTAINEIYTNGIRGIELGIRYPLGEAGSYYYSFMRYYLVRGNFVSFSWTGTLKGGSVNRNLFFNSIQL